MITLATHIHNATVWLITYWSTPAIFFSILWGITAIILFVPKQESKSRFVFVCFYQFWLNFISSFAGWISLSVLYHHYYKFNMKPDTIFVVLFLLGIFGVTGQLAGIIFKITNGFEEILKKRFLTQ